MKKLKYKTNTGMTPLMKTRLTILNTLNDSGLTNAEIVFLMESIKQKTLLAEILTHKEAFKEEYQFLGEVEEKEGEIK